MTENRTHITAYLAELRKEAEENKAVLHVQDSDFIDDNHLHPFWYGGKIGIIEFANGWKISIEVCGEVRLYGRTETGGEIDYVNKNNSGAWTEDVAGLIMSDDHLRALEQEGLIEWGNNNWVEFDLIDPAGVFVDMGIWDDNVLDDNVLEAFSGIGEYAKTIDDYLAQM